MTPVALRSPRPVPATAGAYRLPVETLPQPDETTCGPTCLHAVYNYWGEREPLETVVARSRRLEHGGTLAVFLACDALERGYCATLYTWNITVFDPTWFVSPSGIAERLRRQRDAKSDERLRLATDGYLEFLQLGGRLCFVDLTASLIHGILRRKLPIITGLSATYLYRSAREFGPQNAPDDVRGLPAGHFVVLGGYNSIRRTLMVVDPYQPTPYGPSHEYWLSVERVVGAVLLGIVTHDANLLVVHPRSTAAPEVGALEDAPATL
jgi:hypothetical protein